MLLLLAINALRNDAKTTREIIDGTFEEHWPNTPIREQGDEGVYEGYPADAVKIGRFPTWKELLGEHKVDTTLESNPLKTLKKVFGFVDPRLPIWIDGHEPT